MADPHGFGGMARAVSSEQYRYDAFRRTQQGCGEARRKASQSGDFKCVITTR